MHSLLSSHLNHESTVMCPIKLNDLDITNTNRPLCALEAQIVHIHKAIMSFMLCEELDLEKAGQTINHLLLTYPFLQSKMMFDEKINWLRYDQQPFTLFVPKIEPQIFSLKSTNLLIHEMEQTISPTLLSIFKIYLVEDVQIPTIKFMILFATDHCICDGSAFPVLIKEFNRFYSDPNYALTPIQKASYIGLCSLKDDQPVDYSGLFKLLHFESDIPVTKLKGANPLIQSDLVEPQHDIVLIQNFQLPKLPNTGATLCIYAVSSLIAAAYAYHSQSLKRDEKFHFITTDFRAEHKFLKSQPRPLLDSNFGSTISALPLHCVGELNTTFSEIAGQFRAQNQQIAALSDAQKRGAFIRMGNHSVSMIAKGMPGHFSNSNLGRPDLGIGPIKQFFGASTTKRKSSPQDTFLPHNVLVSGPLGCFVENIHCVDFTTTQNQRFLKMFVAVCKQCAKNPAVKVADVLELFAAFD